ncbi:hypothetical protein BH09MYX1_BH09MYX1_08480 [soil metagenome]
MPIGYSQSPKLVKGALIRIAQDFLGPIPDIIVFQYNPHTLTRTLKPWGSPVQNQTVRGKAENRAQPFDPIETFQLALELDAADALEEPESHPVAVTHGVADRIAALEMLLYPVDEDAPAQSKLPVGGGSSIKRKAAPMVLFVWGPGRILPVRLTSFSVDEQAFLPTLQPMRATVTIGLGVLDDNYFETRRRASPHETLSSAESLALAAYKYTRGQKEALARANLANDAESILGLLRF